MSDYLRKDFAGMTYTLKYPVTLKSGTTITEVTVRRVRGKDMRELDKHAQQPVALTLALIDRLCQFPDGGDVFANFADELDAEDVQALGELVMPDD